MVDRMAEQTAPTVERAIQDPQANRPRRNRRSLAWLEQSALIFVWIALGIAYSIALPTTFPTSTNILGVFSSQAVLLVLTLGLLLPLTVGEFDLSIASVLSLSAMLVAVLNVQHKWPIVLAVAVALLAGVMVGLINGLVVAFGVNSVIATLGMSTVLLGVVSWISHDTLVVGVSDSLVQTVYLHRIFGFAPEFFYGVLAMLAVWYALEFTPAGRKLIFVGRGRSVAKLSGLPVTRIRVGAMMWSGFVAAIAGVLYAGTLGAADPSSGQSFLLPAFAAAFLGATTVKVGRFNPWGTFIAVYVLAIGVNGLQLMGAQSFVQQIFYGAVLVVAVALSTWVRRKRGVTDEPTQEAS